MALGIVVKAKISASPHCSQNCKRLTRIQAMRAPVFEISNTTMDDPFVPRLEVYEPYSQKYVPLCQSCENCSRIILLRESRIHWSSLPTFTGCCDLGLPASGWGKASTAQEEDQDEDAVGEPAVVTGMYQRANVLPTSI